MQLIKKLFSKKDKNGNWRSFGEFLCNYCKLIIVRRLDRGLKAKSCGCLSKNKKHNESKTKLYSVWANIKDRCLNSNNHAFKHYGGRGIKVCPECQDDFVAFRDWSLDNVYKEGLQIDRVDNDKGYYPANCKWIISQLNNQNQRSTKLSLEKANEIRKLYKIGNYSQKEISELFKVSKRNISKLINNKIWNNFLKENF